MKFKNLDVIRTILHLTSLVTLILLTALLGCNGELDNNNLERNAGPIAQIVSPHNSQTFNLGDSIKVVIKINRPHDISTLSLFVDDTLFALVEPNKDQTIMVPTSTNSKVGTKKIFIKYADGERNEYRDNRNIILLSDVIPETKKVEIVQIYPHAKTSYTQGLEFYKGALYEGTGQYNQSILAEIHLESGTRLREHSLPISIFGEGITIRNDSIFQITYHAEVCYIYDMNFNQIGEFSYDGEGWGLSHDSTHLIMTNGSSNVFWRDPQTFEIVKTLEVYDNESHVSYLNELELINGDLYANIYQDNKIAQIDTATGKVISYIDCYDLTLDALEPGNDVLNGIAYNDITGKIYITGKWWSKLFEVKF